MIRSTAQFGQELYNGNRNYICLCRCTLKDGTKLTFDNASLMSYELTDSTSSDGFEIGAAPAKTLSISIQNYDDQYSEYDFYLAEITTYIGLWVNGKIEYLTKGHFTVDDPAAYGSVIKLTLMDDMYKFSRDWETNLKYPATAYAIVSECCIKCGVPLQGHFDNDDVLLQEPDDNANMTFRDVISYCAQATGNFAKITPTNTLRLSWYDMSVLSGLDGGSFHTAKTPYSDGDTADGGNFTNYSSGAAVDGGNFTDSLYTVIAGHSSTNVGTDDIVITGIQIESDGETYVSGTTGYVLAITDNPFITEDNAKSICSRLFQKIGGMTFRKFSVECSSDPRREAGDACAVIDRKGNEYHSVITNITFKYGSNDSVSNDAEDVIEKNSKIYSAATKVLLSSKKYTNKRLSAYDQAVKNMNELAANSMGYYVTYEDDPDTGARISYQHDTPTLGGSTRVWKRTENGLYWTNDYKGASTVWSYGYDVNGNAVMNILSVIGLNADWINVGTLLADRLKGGTLTLGGKDNGNGVQHIVDEKGNILITLDKRGITLADNVTISYSNVSNKPDIVQITKNTVTASYINGLKVVAGSVAAENITGTKITGKEINNGEGTFLVDADGNCTANSFRSSDASITGGTVDLHGKYGALLYVRKDSNSENERVCLSYNEVMIGTSSMSNAIDLSVGSSKPYIAANSSFAFSKIEPDSIYTSGSIQCSGSKSRIAETENYSSRRLFCYETPAPMFGDVGEGILDDTGKCTVWVDEIFSETIDIGCAYHVFTQTYGKDAIRITERNAMYFIAEGTPGERFAWELKAIQKGYDTIRLDEYVETDSSLQADEIEETYEYLETLMYDAEKESEEIGNEKY